MIKNQTEIFSRQHGLVDSVMENNPGTIVSNPHPNKTEKQQPRNCYKMMPRLRAFLLSTVTHTTTSPKMCHQQYKTYACDHTIAVIKKCKNFDKKLQRLCPYTTEYNVQVLDSICPACLEARRVREEILKEQNRGGGATGGGAGV